MVRSVDIYHLALAAVALGLRPEPPPAGEQLSFEDVRPADIWPPEVVEDPGLPNVGVEAPPKEDF